MKKKYLWEYISQVDDYRDNGKVSPELEELSIRMYNDCDKLSLVMTCSEVYRDFAIVLSKQISENNPYQLLNEAFGVKKWINEILKYM